MQLPNPVYLAIPGFILLLAAEMLYGRRSGKVHFEARDTAASLAMGIGSLGTGVAFGFIFLAYAGTVRPYRVADIGWSWSAIAICFVLDDMLYYWWHRTAHRVRWLWAAHVNHHSSKRYNLSTALRQPWTSAFTPGLIFKTPLIILGFPLGMMAFVSGANLVYQYWIHTEAIGRMPRAFEWLMNTPSHHRAHHATNPRYLDTNYAGVFIIWDRVFGTFVAEDATDPPRYGIVKNLASFDPLAIAFHEWLAMGRDLLRARSPRDVAGILLAPPGWQPDGQGETTDAIKARWTAERRGSGPAA